MFISLLLRVISVVELSTRRILIIWSHYRAKYNNRIITRIRFISKRIVITLGIFIFITPANATQASNKDESLNLITNAEQEYGIPKGLLLAVAKTESNLKSFALNIEGRPIFLADKESALKTIRKALDDGITNIDIGVAQINYKWHGSNFSNLEDMISPETNIKYAARLLSNLKQEHGNWHKAIRLYHSAKPKYHGQYSRKVVLCWLSGN
jgi:soluble lytic murein transglycosylase-like protein